MRVLRCIPYTDGGRLRNNEKNVLYKGFFVEGALLPDRLMVGLLPLEQCILVRIQVRQQIKITIYI